MKAHTPLSLPQRLQVAAETKAGVVFCDRREQEVFHSYEQLLVGARHVARLLQSRGIRARERVAIVLPTSPAFYHALFGTLERGAIAVPLYPPVRLGKMAEYEARTVAMLRACGARLVVTTSPLAPLLQQVAAHAHVELGLLEIEPDTQGPVSHVDPALPVLEDDHEPSLDDIALLQYSSGTTGMPKAVALTHRQVAANVDAIVAHINQHVPVPQGAQQHTVVSWLPLYHDMGLMGCVLGALTDKTTLVLLPPEAFVARPALWLRAISRHRASVSAAPNFAYSLAAERVRDEDIVDCDLSTWALALNGAEGVSVSSMQAFATRFSSVGFRKHALTPVYGLAEATLAVTFSSPATTWRVSRSLFAERREPCVSVGRALPGVTVRIVDECDEPLPEGEVGQIAIDGPGVMQGYWQPESEDVTPRAPGLLRTGDLGFEQDGELFVVGREKDVLIVHGRNHSPEGIEAAAGSVSGVRRGCVVAIASRPWGASTDRVVLLAETYVRSPRERQRMRHAVLRAVAGDVQVRVDEVVWLAPGTLPRTSSGKLRRAAARDQYEEGTLRPPLRFAAARLWMRYRWTQLQSALPFSRQ